METRLSDNSKVFLSLLAGDRLKLELYQSRTLPVGRGLPSVVTLFDKEAA